MIGLSACRRRLIPWALSALAGWGLVFSPGDCGWAADVDGRFVEALSERGWSDTAVAYLDWIGKQPTATPTFMARAPYYRGLALLAQADKSLGRSERSALLDRASRELADFAAANPAAREAVDALRQLAYRKFEQAQEATAQAERAGELASDRPTAVAARAGYDAVREAAAQLAAACEKQLAALPKAAAAAVGSDAAARRNELTARLAESEFLTGLAQFESARLHPETSPAAKSATTAALAIFRKLAEEHRSSTIGFSSQFYQGRCHQAAGDNAKALGAYETVVGLPTQEPEWRRWQARAHQYRTQVLVALKKFETAILDADDWIDRAKPEERNRPEWLGVAYEVSLARLALADTLDPKDNEAKRLIADAKTGLGMVAREAGPLQNAARMQLASLGDHSTKREEARTFDEALAAGKREVDMMNSMNLAVRLAKANNPDAVAELEEQAGEHRQAALGYLERAQSLVDRETPSDDQTAVRYYLAWLFWEDGRTQEAAVLGEHLARKHPDSKYAAGGAGIALRAYEKLLAEESSNRAAGGAASGYLQTAQRDICEFIAGKWPRSDDAAAATSILITQALRNDDLPAAEKLLATLPASGRAAAQLSLGASLWAKYLAAAAGVEGEPPAELAAMRQQAAQALEQGYKALGADQPATPAIAAAVLSLAQLRQAVGDSRGAIALLEDERVGALALIKAGSPAAGNPRLVQEAFKTALSAYLAAEPPQLERAQAMMAELESGMGDGPEAKKQLTQLYVSLGVQLQRQLQLLQAAGKSEEAKTLAAAFEELLKRVSDRADAADWSTQLWLAQTSQQLGERLADADARPYFQQAEKAYRALLAAAAKDAPGAPPASELLKVRKFLADALRGQGEYQEALDAYADVLHAHPNMLELQQAAAQTLMDMGVARGNAEAITRSIRGDKPQRGKNLIWGWARLAKTVEAARRKEERSAQPNAQRVAQFNEVFFDASYHVLRAKFELARLAMGVARSNQIATVRQGIMTLKSLYPDLGGPKWQARFKQLEKDLASP